MKVIKNSSGFEFLPKSVRGEGFTLIEVMIAMAIVVVVLVGFMGTNEAIQKSSEAAFQRNIALQDASQVMELIRNAAATPGNFPQNVLAIYPHVTILTDFSNLPNERIIIGYSAVANPLRASVTVQWNENGRRSVSVVLTTLITQKI